RRARGAHAGERGRAGRAARRATVPAGAPAHARRRRGIRPALLARPLCRGPDSHRGAGRAAVARTPHRRAARGGRAVASRRVAGRAPRARSAGMADFVKGAGGGDVPPGTGQWVQGGGRPIAPFSGAGAFHAIDTTCLHRGGPLGEGELEGTVVTCPWHGWQYDVTTGANLDDDTTRVERYEVKLEGGAVLVAV